jgi:hypothetical protein
MNNKNNCWEYKNCGRQPGGAKAAELGVCPSANCAQATGIHGGTAAGRACWALAGTLCGGKVQGEFATKILNCSKCDFYQLVRKEEGADFKMVGFIFDKIKAK